MMNRITPYTNRMFDACNAGLRWIFERVARLVGLDGLGSEAEQ